MKFFRNKYVRRVFIILTALAIFLTGTIVAGAGTLFDDVDDTAIYRDAVEWLVNRAVTLGCGGNNYCPNNRVTRAQMAMFMQRLGTALSPTFIIRNTSGITDANEVLCQTQSNYTPDFPQVAYINANFSMRGDGDGADFATRASYSDDSGTTFYDAPPQWSMGATAQANDYDVNPNFGVVELDPGTNYRFGVRVYTFAGTDCPTCSYECSVIVEVLNRNPATSPLIIGPSGGQQNLGGN
jgi:hypothetical protein